MNIGFEDDELKPYKEPPADVLDPVRIGNAQSMNTLAILSTTTRLCITLSALSLFVLWYAVAVSSQQLFELNTSKHFML